MSSIIITWQSWLIFWHGRHFLYPHIGLSEIVIDIFHIYLTLHRPKSPLTSLWDIRKKLKLVLLQTLHLVWVWRVRLPLQTPSRSWHDSIGPCDKRTHLLQPTQAVSCTAYCFERDEDLTTQHLHCSSKFPNTSSSSSVFHVDLTWSWERWNRPLAFSSACLFIKKVFAYLCERERHWHVLLELMSSCSDKPRRIVSV